MATKKPKAANKTAEVTAKPALIKQERGGALYAGGVPGNKGGDGRPPSQVRTKLRDIVDDNTEVLRQYIEGKVFVRLRQRCEQCGAEPRDAETAEELLKLVPGHGDRIRAYDTAAKYGVGTLTEMSTDEVKEHVLASIAAIRAALPPEQAEIAIKAMEPVWK